MTLAQDHLIDLLVRVTALLPTGRAFAIRGSDLAAELGISERTLRALVDELIDRGHIIGSTCSGERPGYFIAADLDDVEAGCSHLVSRARSLYGRVSRLRRSAEAQFGPEVLRLFDLDEAPSSSSPESSAPSTEPAATG